METGNMELALATVFIYLLLSSRLLTAGDTVQSTNFLDQTPSSEQLVEALKTPRQLKFRGIAVRPIKSKVLLNIKFKFDSDMLTQVAVQTLSELGKAMEHDELKNAAFIIEGHTDAKGTGDYNQKLSQMRTLSVYNYLKNIIKSMLTCLNQLARVKLNYSIRSILSHLITEGLK
jgi:outer membrane protein OmpA-like peptidoglycan-associated protein